MSLQEFKTHIKNRQKPDELNPYLEAMYEDALGDWEKAHEIAQNCGDMYGNWIHAYLHRKEGDRWNARYWYGNAGKTMPNYSLDREWEEICEELLRL